MLTEETLLKLLIIHNLIHKNEWTARELAWEIGIKPEKLIELISDLQNNFLIEYSGGRVFWNPADIPSYIKPWGWTLIHRSLLGSTQDAARGYGPWTIIVSEYMLWGKGRFGKTWRTSLGGLWTTFKVMIRPETAVLLPIIIPTILVRILRKHLNIDARIKWPNDIIVGDKKLAGILIEAEAFQENILAYIGIGLNVNNDPPVEEAVSIKAVTGSLTPRNRILSTMIGWISRIPKLAEDPEEVKEEYIENLATLGKRIEATMKDGSIIRGVAKGVDDRGSLIVELEEGGEKILDATDTYRLKHLT